MILKILGLVLFFELYNYWFVRLKVRRAVCNGEEKEGFRGRRSDFPFLFRDPIARDCEQTGVEVSYETAQ